MTVGPWHSPLRSLLRTARHRTGSLILSGLLVATTATADAEPPVVTVGPVQFSLEQLQQRLDGASKARLNSFGKTSKTQAQGFIAEVLVPQTLFDIRARELKLHESSALRDRHNALLVRTLEHALEAKAARKVTAAQIGEYYEKHKAQYERPKRLLLWRILLPSEKKAQEVLKEARGVQGPERWSQLCREHSLDAATKMRRGTLGFVHPDGKTDYPEVRVSAELYAAASGVKDGELVPKPIPEGDRFAVVWRRGSLPAEKPAFADFADDIRLLLAREKARESLGQLLVGLREKHVSEVEPERLTALDEAWLRRAFDAPKAAASSAPAPLASVKKPPPKSAAPEPGERGLK